MSSNSIILEILLFDYLFSINTTGNLISSAVGSKDSMNVVRDLTTTTDYAVSIAQNFHSSNKKISIIINVYV